MARLKLNLILIAAVTVELGSLCGVAAAQNQGDDPVPAQQPRAGRRFGRCGQARRYKNDD